MPEARLVAEAAAGNATLSYSDDGGATYVTHAVASLNQTVQRWTRLGSFYRRNIRLLLEANARVAVSGLRVRAESVMS